MNSAVARSFAPDDPGFREKFLTSKRDAKTRFANWLKTTSGQEVDPNTIFDSQIKRIHDTALPRGDDFCERGMALEQSSYQVDFRSVVVLVRRRTSGWTGGV